MSSTATRLTQTATPSAAGPTPYLASRYSSVSRCFCEAIELLTRSIKYHSSRCPLAHNSETLSSYLKIFASIHC